MALGEALHPSFKLVRASVSNKDELLGLLNNEPRLLTAKFEINKRVYPVIIDTGATISFVPEYGNLMRDLQLSVQPANVHVKLGDEQVVYINKKTYANIKPANSKVKPIKANFYINPNADRILGHEALIGLNHLKLFNLDIQIRKNLVAIFHEGRLIGQETPVFHQIEASMKVIDIFDSIKDACIKRILKRHKGSFSDIVAEPVRGRPMRILTTHLRPIFTKQRHYNPDEVTQMKTHVRNLLDKGIIEPTNSGYAATSRIIPKKSGAGRLVVNYIPLNAATLRDSYSLPHIADIIAVLQGKQYFSTMDCAQGFYQILVDPRDRHKTAFSTPIGNYQFKRCPFGARNSCAYFQAEMNRIFADGLYTRCVIYVDDILVFGETREEHDHNLDWVLSKCDEFNLKIKFEKCSFARKEVDYLGFTITGDSIQPMRSKVDTLCLQKPPKDKTELRSLIGKLNFYSRFIPAYSNKIEPLRELFRKNKDFQWKDYHQNAFKVLLESLKDAAIHKLVDRRQNKTIMLEVMDNSFEAMLITPDDRLIHRTGRLMSSAETNYSIVEQHLMALVMAINKFKVWLYPGKFKVRLPTNQVEKALKLVNRPERVDNILLRMPEGFDTFDFEIKGSLVAKRQKKIESHIPEEIYYVDGACKNNGKPNGSASWAVCAEFDRELAASGLVESPGSNNKAELSAAIEACRIAKARDQKQITIVTDSKYLHSAATEWTDKWKSNGWLDHKKKPVVNVEVFERLLNAKEGLQIEWIHVKGHSDSEGNIRADNLARGRLEESLEVLCASVHQVRDIQEQDSETRALRMKIDREKPRNFIIEDDVIYFIDNKLPEGSEKRVFVPQSNRSALLRLAHDDLIHGGHLGIKKTYRKLIKYWWPRMHESVETYVKSCDSCQKFKNAPGVPVGYLQSIPVSSIFEHLHLDIVGPVLPTYRGNKYIITATDAFSKWAFAQPLQSTLTRDVINFIENTVLAIHGKPKSIITDRGVQFTSHEWINFIKSHDIEHKLTSAYHPQSNGIDERLNGTLVRILRHYIDEHHSDWDSQLKWALYAYNTSVHESTGFSPYQTMFGLDSRSPLKSHNSSDLDRDRLDEVRVNVRRETNRRNIESQAKQKKNYDLNRRENNFKVGDFVLIKNHTVPSHPTGSFTLNGMDPASSLSYLGQKALPKQ